MLFCSGVREGPRGLDFALRRPPGEAALAMILCLVAASRLCSVDFVVGRFLPSSPGHHFALCYQGPMRDLLHPTSLVFVLTTVVSSSCCQGCCSCGLQAEP